jgi:phosphoesterase RecJ-like protein
MQRVFDFINRNSSMILTSHEGADADGLGAELLFAHILRTMGKGVRIINAGLPAERYTFLDPHGTIEVWDPLTYDGTRDSALVLVDTSDEFNIGAVKDLIPQVREIFVIDHHELNPYSTLSGFIDSTASSTCEIVLGIAETAGVKLDEHVAMAAFAGISYDSGSFAYRKTTAKTFKAALSLVEAGVSPWKVYSALNESASTGALLLQKQVLSTLDLHAGGRIAVQILRKEDLESTGADFEDAEAFINIPLKSRDVAVSIMIKENRQGLVRCSLRSKGTVNVSKIAQAFGGGGHSTAAGFKSAQGISDTLDKILKKVGDILDT